MPFYRECRKRFPTVRYRLLALAIFGVSDVPAVPEKEMVSNGPVIVLIEDSAHRTRPAPLLPVLQNAIERIYRDSEHPVQRMEPLQEPPAFSILSKSMLQLGMEIHEFSE
jgi:hypothetical protein